MKLTEFTRDKKRVYSAIVEKDNTLVAKEAIYIYIPQRFEQVGLAYIGNQIYIVGLYMMATKDKKYAVSSITAMVPITPTSVNKTKLDDIPYYEFYFRAGSVIINNLNLVKENKLTYDIFNEVFSKGNLPVYMNYVDFSTIFNSAHKHAGVDLGENPEVLELVSSMLARDPKDKKIYYRQIVKTKEDVVKILPAIIALRSVQYAATNTTNKLGGSYFRPATVSALVNRTERRERVEKVLVGD